MKLTNRFKNITAAVCGLALTVAFALTSYAQPAPNAVAGPATPLGLGEEMEEPGEAALIASITQQTLARLKLQYPAGKGLVLRDVHPKTHGLVRAQFIVVDSIPLELQHGVFAQARKFDALIRFSADGVAVLPDTVEQARGMAIKLLGVGGDKLLDDERNAQTQDFVMINFPVFFSRNLKDYEELHRALAAGTAADFFSTRPVEKKAFYEINH
ncbi:MAG: catalase [Gammaproteobacteria bacterium]|nr:catalase [Gammaproteobacteria bacterium]